MADNTKLIEVSIPLEVINRESAREKSIRHGHPSTLHLWWARRPLAAARAVLFAQLVDDPSAHPESFPTEADQKRERDRLHKIMERLVVWENLHDERLITAAREEILKSTGGKPPPIMDPFAGGGTIPLEAQRLGLEAHASDLNPVAILINKAQIEFPPKFRGRKPVYPGLAESEIAGWHGARGLAADVKAYGAWMCDEAFKRIGHLYPPARLPSGEEVPAIAWIWTRTVVCPNPACRMNMPLVKSWWLSKKKGDETFILPKTAGGNANVSFAISREPSTAPINLDEGTVGRQGAYCIKCDTPVDLKYIRAEGRAKRISHQLMAIVAVSAGRRVFLPPDEAHVTAAQVPLPEDIPDGELPANPRDFKTPNYGLTRWSDLFTSRQLTALTTFSDLVTDARDKALADALATDMPAGKRLEDEGAGAEAYADAIAVYLGMGLSRMTDISNALCRWENTKQQVRNLFGRQAIPMLWDFAETAPFGRAAGAYEVSLGSLVKAIKDVDGPIATVKQADASTASYEGMLLSTDPPYYDNIGYSDLSDFFYVWQRRTLRAILPSLYRTVLVPKSEELVANPYRHDGQEGARDFFEDGFRKVFAQARRGAISGYPITVYYAFKQSETDEQGQASTGWETLLDGMVHNGWTITSTWPLRSELSNRMLASGNNALASSIVLSLRPRPDNAPTQDRRGFIEVMKHELGPALQKLQAGGIAPVDLPQSAIGPGMAVFSRYSAVLEPDGSRMTVRSALARINEVLDEVLSEQEGDFDATTRFAIAWFRTHGYNDGEFGDADNLARARATVVAKLERAGILTARKGVVRLYRPSDLSDDYEVISDDSVSTWEVSHHLIRIMESQGVPAAGAFLARAARRTDGAVDSDLIPELAHLSFRIAEENKWTKDAISFNSLVTAWPDIVDASRTSKSGVQQGALDFSADD